MVNLFRSTDTGALLLRGTSGTNGLILLLNSVLIANVVQKFNGNTLAFTDITSTILGDTTSAGLFPQPASGDILYLGGQAKFNQIDVSLGTVAIGGTFVYEYWNGSAWVTLVSATDGTAGLTASGRITWSAAAQTGWATTAINSTTLFWVRIRATAAISQNPTAVYLSIYGWSSPYTGTNARTYRSTLTSGVQHWFTINDNAPTTDAKDATLWGNETDPGAIQTAPQASPQAFPTNVQLSTGLYIRKSNTADNTNSRTWLVLADEKTCYIFVLSADTANTYVSAYFGEYYSLVNGDSYRSAVVGRLTKSATTNGQGLNSMGLRNRSDQSIIVITAAGMGIFVARGYQGSGASLQGAIGTGLPSCLNGVTQLGGGRGMVATFNGPDGGVFIAPVFLFSDTTNVRGRFRGIWDWGHPLAAVNDGDTFGGNSLLSSKTFRATRLIPFIDGTAGVSIADGVLALETSDTWETN